MVETHSIKVSTNVLDGLREKQQARETYNDVIKRLLFIYDEVTLLAKELTVSPAPFVGGDSHD